MTSELEQIGSRRGLPVTSRPEWAYARRDGLFSFEVELLGEHIAVTRATGYASVDDAERTLALSTAVVDCYLPPPRTYVTIVDFRQFEGATPAAKRHFVRRMTARPRMAAVVFCGLSPLLRMSVLMGRRLGHLVGRVDVARTLEEAVDMATERLRRVADASMSAGTTTDGAAESPPPIHLRHEVDPAWRVERSDFHAEMELFDGRILFVRLHGFLRGEVIEDLVNAAQGILEEPGRGRRLDYVVADLSGVVGGAPDARRRYLEALQARDIRRPLLACFIFGGRARVRAAASLARFTLPFPLRTVDDLSAALRAIDELERPASARGWLGRLGLRRRSDRREPSADASEVLRHLGRIRWDQEGVTEPDLPAHHPMRPVFEAINLIKWEFDELVAARQRAFDDVERAGAQRQALLEMLPDGVILLDPDGQALLVNPAAQRLLPGLATYDGSERLRAVASIPIDELCRRGARPHWHELEASGADGRIVEIAGAELDGGLGVVLVRDVSRDRQQAAQLASQERLAAVGQLAAGVAHDFNNLLQVVASSAELLADGAADDASRELVRSIRDQCGRGARLIRQILDFGRRSASLRQRLDLGRLLDETVAMLTRTLPESIAIEVDARGGPFPARIDAGQVQQMLTNLAVNARDAMPGGGNLAISLTKRLIADGEDPPVVGMQPGPWIVLAVADTGCGIEAGDQERIFEPFFTTKPAGAGSGLGLSQVYGLVRQQDGFVRCSSRVGEGSVFSLYFPQCAAADDDAKPAPAPQKPVAVGSSVLLVEDDAAVARLVRRSLEALGFEVISASNGAEALEVLKQLAAPVQLVVSDLVMPGMGGFELAAQLRERFPGLPILLASGYPLGEEVRARGFDERIGWLGKPFTRGELSKAVDRLLHVP